MGLFSWLFGSEESRNEARLRRREAEIEKELAALAPQIEADRERLMKAAQSPRDADLANLLIAQINEEIGLAAKGSSGMSALRRADKLKEELAEIRRQLDEIGKKRMEDPHETSKHSTATLELVPNLSPPAASDEDEYVRRCLTVELRDEDEVRTFNSDPAFDRVLSPLNSQRYDPAIAEAKKLLTRYRDFDLIYDWLGSAYLETQQLELARQTFREGISQSKRKCLLLTGLGETEWRMGNVEDGLYWLSQALHCLALNPIEHTAYLLLGYLAKGISMQEEADLFFARVDRMRAGKIRLPAAHAERLMNLCRQGRTEPMRKVIRGLVDKRLN